MYCWLSEGLEEERLWAEPKWLQSSAKRNNIILRIADPKDRENWPRGIELFGDLSLSWMRSESELSLPKCDFWEQPKELSCFRYEFVVTHVWTHVYTFL